MSSLPCRNKFLALALKKYAKIDIRVLRACLNLLDFLIFAKVFYKGLQFTTWMRKHFHIQRKIFHGPKNILWSDFFYIFMILQRKITLSIDNLRMTKRPAMTVFFLNIAKLSFTFFLYFNGCYKT